MTGPSVGQPPPSVAGGVVGGGGVVNIKLLLVIWQAWLWMSVFYNFPLYQVRVELCCDIKVRLIDGVSDLLPMLDLQNHI